MFSRPDTTVRVFEAIRQAKPPRLYVAADGPREGRDDVAKLFCGKIEMLPERKGNRMTTDVVTDKTQALGWQPKRNLSDYIETL